MASAVPDLQSLSSWEDAFQYPLPVVRRLEQQLRKNIDENRQKLRSLVGASYRDLLGTAEKIIEMDQQMTTVEGHLGDISRKCNARAVERIAGNHVQMQDVLKAREKDKYRVLAQTKILQSALTMLSRTIKTGGSALCASKLLVLSRLLYKEVSEEADSPPVVDDFRRKLASLRTKLLNYIDRMAGKPFLDLRDQTQTLCAYVLVTSSTPREALRHFLNVRYGQLENQSASLSGKGILILLEVYSQTLSNIRDLFPRAFADALSRLARVPILQDEQIQSLFELNLDIYGTWISEDVRTFTPWVQHSPLSLTEVGDALRSWTAQAEQLLLQGLQISLQHEHDAGRVVNLRAETVSKYLSLGAKLRDAGLLQTTGRLQEVFQAKLEELAATATSIEDPILEESAISSVDGSYREDRNVWQIASRDLDLESGAWKFRHSVLRSHHGRDNAVEDVTAKLDAWAIRIEKFLDLVDAMRAAKWDHDMDLDLEDLPDHGSLIQGLNSEDPARLTETVREGVNGSLKRVIEQLQQAAASTKHADFYIRVWREVDQRRRGLGDRLDLTTDKVSLADLYRNIAVSVSKDAMDRYLQSYKVTQPGAVALWDGSPPLPVLPTPATFRFIITVHRAMSQAGNDLWTPDGVLELKLVLLKTLGDELLDHEVSHEPGVSTRANGHAEVDTDEETHGEVIVNGIVTAPVRDREHLLQLLFDVHYLLAMLNNPIHDNTNSKGFAAVVERLKVQLQLDEAVHGRLKKSASEYWKKTYLLFGLLASRGASK